MPASLPPVLESLPPVLESLPPEPTAPPDAVVSPPLPAPPAPGAPPVVPAPPLPAPPEPVTAPPLPVSFGTPVLSPSPPEQARGKAKRKAAVSGVRIFTIGLRKGSPIVPGEGTGEQRKPVERSRSPADFHGRSTKIRADEAASVRISLNSTSPATSKHFLGLLGAPRKTSAFGQPKAWQVPCFRARPTARST